MADPKGLWQWSWGLWFAVFGTLSFLAGVPGVAAAPTCLAGARPQPIREPERDLAKVERVAKSVVSLAKKELCPALKHFDVPAIRSHLSDDGRFERWFLNSPETVVSSSGGQGSVRSATASPCWGTAEDLLADLEQLTADWLRVERCAVKPFRILATPASLSPAQIAFDFELGGITATGSRVLEQVVVEAEIVGDPAAGWRFTWLELGAGQRFETPRPAFRDKTRAAGLPVDWPDEGYDPRDIAHGQILYGGIALGDFDQDRWLDLYVSRAGENLLLRNRGGGQFEDVTAAAGVGDPGNSQAALWADFDNDGDLDLLVVNAWYSLIQGPATQRGHQVYRNQGGRFTPAAELGPIGPASGATAADYDGDGRLDIYITYYQDKNLNPYHHYIEARDGQPNRLYRNLGDWQFADVTAAAGVGNTGWSFAAAWADYDDDGQLDVFVANDYGDDALYRNLGNGTFAEVAVSAGVNDPANGMGADWGDYDNDGRLDLYIANMYSKTGRQFLNLYQGLEPQLLQKLRFSAEGNSLYRNLGDGTFRESARQLGASRAGWAWGVNFFDYDNDGWLDVHAANGFWAGAVETDA